MASLIAVTLLAAGTSMSSAANDVPGSDLVAHRPDVEAQVQIPGVDINPTRWVQDAFSALLQSFSDGIREPDVTWLSFLVGAATLWLTFRIPSLMRAGAGGNIADMLAKALVLRFALRGGGGASR